MTNIEQTPRLQALGYALEQLDPQEVEALAYAAADASTARAYAAIRAYN
jgi:hypothetical protein